MRETQLILNCDVSAGRISKALEHSRITDVRIGSGCTVHLEPIRHPEHLDPIRELDVNAL